MRAAIREILRRRRPEALDDFVAVQVSRLNEALLVAYEAMSPENLGAVRLVVQIVRELDRYHGFLPAARRPLRDGSGDDELALLADRPQTATQASEKTPFAPRKGAAAEAPVDAIDFCAVVNERSPGAEGGRAGETQAGGAQMAPQALEISPSAPGNGAAPGASDGAPSAPAPAPAPGAPLTAGLGVAQDNLEVRARKGRGIESGRTLPRPGRPNRGCVRSA